MGTDNVTLYAVWTVISDTITINPGESYEFFNNDTIQHTILANGNSTYNRIFDYAVYNQDGTAYSKEMSTTTGTINIPAGGRIVVTVLSTSNAVDFGGYNEFFTGQSSTDPALYKVRVNPGQSHEFFSSAAVVLSFLANGNSTYNRIFDYAVYNQDGTAYSKEMSTTTGKINIPAGGRIVVTVLSTSNAMDFGGYNEFFTGQSSTDPALYKVRVNPGQSHEFFSSAAVVLSFLANGNSTYNRIFDYAVYNQDGTAYSKEMSTTTGTISVPAGCRIVVTVLSTSNAVDFGGYNEFFTGQSSTDPALYKVRVNPGQSHEFFSSAAVVLSFLANGNSTYNRIFDYAVYNQDGTAYSNEISSTTGKINIPAGGRIVVTVLSTSNAMDFGGYYEFFTGQSTSIPACTTMYVMPGDAYEYVNITSGRCTLLLNGEYEFLKQGATIATSNMGSLINSLITVDAGDKIIIRNAGNTASEVRFNSGVFTTSSFEMQMLFASRVIDSYYSGTNPNYSEFYGSYDSTNVSNVTVDVVLGPDIIGQEDYLSLPAGSFVIVGFSNPVVDIPGSNEIFIKETGNYGDNAEVWISEDNSNFVLLGQAYSGGITSFDLGNINFEKPVAAIKIVGLDMGSDPTSTKGFDLCSVMSIRSDSVVMPAITGIIAADTGNNVGLGNGDTITIIFDVATNRSCGGYKGGCRQPG